MNGRRRFDVAIIPCSREKAWDDRRVCGPVAARDAYRSPLFAAARAWAEGAADRWLVLSALHGLVPAEAQVPGPYDVTFSRTGDPVVTAAALRHQAEALGLLALPLRVALALPDDYAVRIRVALGAQSLGWPNLLAGVPLDDLEAMRHRCEAALLALESAGPGGAAS